MEDDDISRVSGTNGTEEKYTMCFDRKTYRGQLGRYRHRYEMWSINGSVANRMKQKGQHSPGSGLGQVASSYQYYNQLIHFIACGSFWTN
jgi:hypothetical protein